MVWAFVVANIKPDQEVFPKSMAWRERGCRTGRPEVDTGTERETWGPAELPVREIATSVSLGGKNSDPYLTSHRKTSSYGLTRLTPTDKSGKVLGDATCHIGRESERCGFEITSYKITSPCNIHDSRSPPPQRETIQEMCDFKTNWPSESRNCTDVGSTWRGLLSRRKEGPMSVVLAEDPTAS